MVGERAHRLVCAQWHPHEEDKSSREVVSSFYVVVCNGCGIFFSFPSSSVLLVFTLLLLFTKDLFILA